MKQIAVGTKGSDIYLMGLLEQSENGKRIMSGHNDGYLHSVVLHKTEPHMYTGGEDKRLIKWDYANKREILAEKKCPYAIRTLAINFDAHT